MSDEELTRERLKERQHTLMIHLISLMDVDAEPDEWDYPQCIAHLRLLLHVDQMAGEGATLSPAEIDNLRGLAGLLPELRLRSPEGARDRIYLLTREREKQLDDLLERIDKSKGEVKKK